MLSAIRKNGTEKKITKNIQQNKIMISDVHWLNFPKRENLN